MTKSLLVITPSVPVWRDGDLYIFDRKFYDGIVLYVELWVGEIRCIMTTTNQAKPEFGLIYKKEKELPFQCTILNNYEKINKNHLAGASIVLASGDSFNQFHLSKLCKAIKTKCIYIIEYIPETRYQIASLSTKNFIVKLRRFFYLWNGERKRLTAFSLSNGLQMNGFPAFYEYRKFRNSIIYYDNRVYKNLIIGIKELENRVDYLLKNKPLRLAFSGRLIHMKGVDHLLKIAKLLKERGIIFNLTIYGTGNLKNEMDKFITSNNLANCVEMRGSVDFYKTLLPELKQSVDLFVCLHRQSDPSCTYLETLSCGIPIVGYENKAFSGLLKQADIGWGAKLNDINGIVKIIESLDKNREMISLKSKLSMIFALSNDFESTFRKRIVHLQKTIEDI